MSNNCLDSFSSIDSLTISNKSYKFYNINKVAHNLGLNINNMPFSIRILFENLLRNEDGSIVTKSTIINFTKWLEHVGKIDFEIPFYPTRVLMQDFTGVPAIVDLAAMRDVAKSISGRADFINPVIPTVLVIDHSVQVDSYGNSEAMERNIKLEMERNIERYEFLKWAQSSFDNLTIVPPGIGICHQINLEYIASVIFCNDIDTLYPDTVIGTDSHTTMINGLSVLGWGVGGIEAESAMLGQSISLILPEVIGVKITGKLQEGIMATDVVLTITQMLRKYGVVGKFVEFFGSGLDELTLPDRATIANMAPEYGATCGFFPIDDETIKYLKLTGRSEEQISIVETYAKAQNLWRSNDNEIKFTHVLEIDLSAIQISIAGPKRPQDRLTISEIPSNFRNTFNVSDNIISKTTEQNEPIIDGDIVIAAITSCTNTSNPSVMIAAGLAAKKAIKLGLRVKNFVKTSLSLGSHVVSAYLQRSGLQKYLDELGFHLTGYGCMTCIGNSGPLKYGIEEEIKKNSLTVAAILSGNRNFEGRVHNLIKANYLASPPLVIAYSILGNVNHDISATALGFDKNGKGVFLKDIWPSKNEIDDVLLKNMDNNLFKEKYSNIFNSNISWNNINVSNSENFLWKHDSTYIEKPPYFDNLSTKLEEDICFNGARCLLLLGDSITTDHISPAGNIADNSPASIYLNSKDVKKEDFNVYGARRGSHNVMMRGTFANVRLKNEMLESSNTPQSIYFPSNISGSVYDIAMKYMADNTSLIIVAGKEYGTGSSRDWAAKGTNLLGIKVVIAESFERIHRSNLVGMGVLPLQFINNMTRKTLNLTGCEIFDIKLGDLSSIGIRSLIDCLITYQDNHIELIQLLCRIDTSQEMQYYKAGSVLRYVVQERCKSYNQKIK